MKKKSNYGVRNHLISDFEKQQMRDQAVHEIETTKEKVRYVLEKDIRARNDDTWLIYKVCSLITKVYIPYEDFKKLPSFETITRIRRYFQNNLKTYMPSDKTIALKRGIKEYEYIKYWSSVS